MSVTALAPRLFEVQQAPLDSDEHYTPRRFFETMGIDFDLDVCAPPGGIPWIPAKRYFTHEDDGLAQPWEGRVWMNPPYSNAGPWVDRFFDHGHGVALLPTVKTSLWSRRIWDEAPAVVLNHDVIWFHRPDGSTKPIIYLSMFAAFGDDCIEAISKLGRVRR